MNFFSLSLTFICVSLFTDCYFYLSRSHSTPCRNSSKDVHINQIFPSFSCLLYKLFNYRCLKVWTTFDTLMSRFFESFGVRVLYTSFDVQCSISFNNFRYYLSFGIHIGPFIFCGMYVSLFIFLFSLWNSLFHVRLLSPRCRIFVIFIFTQLDFKI